MQTSKLVEVAGEQSILYGCKYPGYMRTERGKRREKIMDRDTSVGIGTRYGLDGPVIESRWGRDILQLSRPALGSTHPPIQGVLGLSQE
jgi:hypothetical protein